MAAEAETVGSHEVTAQRTYEVLRNAILKGEFEPGATFNQVRLAERLEVSRTPLREALRRLQSEGLVEGEPNRRVRVAPISVPDLEELYASRIALESLGVLLTVPRLAAADLEQLDALLRVMEDAARDGQRDAMSAAHRAFHSLLFSRSGERMRRQLTDLFDHGERYRLLYLGAPEVSVLHGRSHAEHLAMVRAARAGSATTAAEQVARHLARVALTVLATVDSGHDPITIREAVRFVTRDT